MMIAKFLPTRSFGLVLLLALSLGAPILYAWTAIVRYMHAARCQLLDFGIVGMKI